MEELQGENHIFFNGDVADAGVCGEVLGKHRQINPKFHLSSLICGLCDDYPLVSVPMGGGGSWCVECRFECNRSSSDWYWSPRLPESVFRKRQIGICVPSCKRAERIQFYAVVSRWYINNTPAWSHQSTISLLNLSLFIVHPLFFFTCGFFFSFFFLNLFFGFPAPFASHHSVAGQRADQRAFPLGPASVRPGAAHSWQCLCGAWTSWRRPTRRFSHHSHVWGHWR